MGRNSTVCTVAEPKSFQTSTTIRSAHPNRRLDPSAGVAILALGDGSHGCLRLPLAKGNEGSKKASSSPRPSRLLLLDVWPETGADVL